MSENKANQLVLGYFQYHQSQVLLTGAADFSLCQVKYWANKDTPVEVTTHQGGNADRNAFTTGMEQFNSYVADCLKNTLSETVANYVRSGASGSPVYPWINNPWTAITDRYPALDTPVHVLVGDGIRYVMLKRETPTDDSEPNVYYWESLDEYDWEIEDFDEVSHWQIAHSVIPSLDERERILTVLEEKREGEDWDGWNEAEAKITKKITWKFSFFGFKFTYTRSW